MTLTLLRKYKKKLKAIFLNLNQVLVNFFGLETLKKTLFQISCVNNARKGDPHISHFAKYIYKAYVSSAINSFILASSVIKNTIFGILVMTIYQLNSNAKKKLKFIINNEYTI